MTSCDNVLAERLISALFRVERASTHHEVRDAKAALGRVVQETVRAGVAVTRVSRMSGLSLSELRQLLD